MDRRSHKSTTNWTSIKYADIVSALAAHLVIIPWPISTKIPPVYPRMYEYFYFFKWVSTSVPLEEVDR